MLKKKTKLANKPVITTNLLLRAEPQTEIIKQLPPINQIKFDYEVFRATNNSLDSCIQNLNFDGTSTITFQLILPSTLKISLSLLAPEDYPKGEFMLISPGDGLRFSSGNDMKLLGRGKLGEMFTKIQEEYWKPAVAEKASALVRKLLKESVNLRQSQLRQTNAVKKSQGNNLRESLLLNENDEDQEFDDLDQYFIDTDTHAPGVDFNVTNCDPLDEIVPDEARLYKKKLKKQIKKAIRRGYRIGRYTNRHKVHVVRFAIDTTYLNQWSAQAWAIDNTKPIIVEMMFTWRYIYAKKLVTVSF